jgi:hypothetical protein
MPNQPLAAQGDVTPGSSLASSYQTISSHVSVVAPSLQAGTMSDSAASGQESIDYSAAPSVASERNTPFSGSDAGSWITLNTAHENADALEDIFERMNALLIQQLEEDRVEGNKTTSLHYSIQKQSIAAVKFLLKGGASWTKCNAHGKNALQLAEETGNQGLINIVRRYAMPEPAMPAVAAVPMVVAAPVVPDAKELAESLFHLLAWQNELTVEEQARYSVDTVCMVLQDSYKNITPEVLQKAFALPCWMQNRDIRTLDVASAAYHRIYRTLYEAQGRDIAILIRDIAILTNIAYDIRLLSSLVSSSIQFAPEQIVAIVRKANDILLDQRTGIATANLLLDPASVTEFGRTFINSQVYKMVMTGNALVAADLRLLVDFFSTFNIAKVQALHESVCYLVGKMLTSPSANVDIDVCESVFRVLADVKSSREAAGVDNAPEYESKVYSELSAKVRPFLSAAATAAEANRLLSMCNDEDLRKVLQVIDVHGHEDVISAIRVHTAGRLDKELSESCSIKRRWDCAMSRLNNAVTAGEELLIDLPNDTLDVLIYTSSNGDVNWSYSVMKQRSLLPAYIQVKGIGPCLQLSTGMRPDL